MDTVPPHVIHRKSFKFRLYPTKAQEQKLTWTLDRCRELHNACLQERRDAYSVIKQHPNYYDTEWRKQAVKDHAISYFDQQNQLPEIKEIRKEYQEIAAHVLQNVCKRVDLAFQKFFRQVKSGEKAGYPRFKGKNRYDSFTYPDMKGLRVEGKHVILPKIGSIKIKLHRPIEGKIKTATIKREGDQWYVYFACEISGIQGLSASYEDVGIDLGVTHFAALSNGEFIDNPKYYRKGEKKLAKAHQSLDCKKKGSHRRDKAKKRLSRAYRKVRNQRKDFLHKQSRKIVDQYQVIVFENLQVANLNKRPKPKQDETGKYLPNGASAKAGLNKSISDAGWGTFVQYCSYKAEEAGRIVVKVNPKYTSQVCSGCGTVRKKTLEERWHSCECGCELDRDTNAAINILRLGKAA